MDTIIVKTKEDMGRILEWVRDSHDLFANRPEFQCPFQKGEVRLPFDGCRLEFERQGETHVQFKLYPILEAFSDLDWTKDMTEENLLLGGFLLDVDTLEISGKQFNMRTALASVALSYEQDGGLFKALAMKWLAIMLLAVYYRPQFESKRQITVSSVKGKKSKKAKKGKRTKTLYTRTYVIGNDLTEDLPKAVKRRAKPDHEYGVRGHYRRYKSGKVAWVRPHIRCKGRKPGDGNTYVAKIADEK